MISHRPAYSPFDRIISTIKVHFQDLCILQRTVWYQGAAEVHTFIVFNTFVEYGYILIYTWARHFKYISHHCWSFCKENIRLKYFRDNNIKKMLCMELYTTSGARFRCSTPFPVTADDFPGDTFRPQATNDSKVILSFHKGVVRWQWVRATKCWKIYTNLFIHKSCLSTCLHSVLRNWKGTMVYTMILRVSFDWTTLFCQWNIFERIF